MSKNISDKIVQCLEALDIKYVFTIPGKEIAALLFALGNSISPNKIEVVVCRHEQAATFMADGYARVTGKPQVVLTTLGPGAANAVTGVANALLDQVPVMMITGQAPTSRMHRESFQLIDTRTMFAPLTAGVNEPIRNAEAVPELINKAYRLAISNMGPTHIVLPEDMAKQPIEEAQWAEISPLSPCTFDCTPYPNEEMVKQVSEFLMQRKNPVILAGKNSVLHPRNISALRQFVDKTDIMVMTTTVAKGVIAMDHPNSLYSVGFTCSWHHLRNVLRDSDCVISVGYDQREFQPELWNSDKSQNIIHIDYKQTESNEHFNPKFEVVGEIGVALEHMASFMEKKGKRFERDRHFLQARTELKGLIESPPKEDDALSKTPSRIKPQKILYELGHVLHDKENIIVTDVGNHMLFVSKYWTTNTPRSCIVPSNFATMGYGLPAAIGIKLARPDKNVVAIVGDGGLMMNLQEMETAKRLGANILVFVFNDKSYGMIRWEMETEYGEGKSTAVDFDNPDFVQIAQAFGWTAYRCLDSSEIRITQAQALTATQNGPVLVDVGVDYISTMRDLNE